MQSNADPGTAIEQKVEMMRRDDIRSSEPFASERKVGVAVLLLFAVLGLGLYADVILNGIFLFDDFEYIIDNGIIRDISRLSLNDTRQICYLTFAINFAFGRENPFGYHLVNVLIHVLNAILTFFLLRLILHILYKPRTNAERAEQRATVFLASLMFLIHPIATMAVSYVSQRFTSLATMFYLGSIFGYLSARLRLEAKQLNHAVLLGYGASLLCTLLAMRTKEISFTIPIIVAALELLLFGGSRLGHRRFLYLIPYALLLAVIPLTLFGPEFGLFDRGRGIIETIRADKISDLTHRSSCEYLATQFRVIVIYLKLLVFPVGQCVYHDIKISRSFLEPSVLLSMLFLGTIISAAVAVWKRTSDLPLAEKAQRRLASLGVLWFFLTLSVESSIVPIKDVMFEHRIYLPSVGVFAVISVGLFWLLKRGLPRAGTTALTVIASIALVSVLGTATVLRNRIWNDELLFWQDVVLKNPNKLIAYRERGNALARHGMLDQALADMDRVIAAIPKNPMAALKSYEIGDLSVDNIASTYMSRASIYGKLGKKDLAQLDMKYAMEILSRPRVDIDDMGHRAEMYAKQGLHQYAIDAYSKVLMWAPDDVNALMSRAGSYFAVERYEEAANDLSRVMLLDPDSTLAVHNRGFAYARAGQRNKAITDLKEACRRGFQSACEGADDLITISK